MIRSFDPEVMRKAFEPYPEYNEGVDYEAWVNDENNIMFVEGDSVGLLTYNYPGVYTGHYFFKVHGKEAFDLCRRIVSRMIDKYGAKTFRGLTSVDNRKALTFNRRLGMKSHGIVPGNNGPVELFTMTAEEFKEKNNGS